MCTTIYCIYTDIHILYLVYDTRVNSGHYCRVIRIKKLGVRSSYNNRVFTETVFLWPALIIKVWCIISAHTDHARYTDCAHNIYIYIISTIIIRRAIEVSTHSFFCNYDEFRRNPRSHSYYCSCCYKQHSYIIIYSCCCCCAVVFLISSWMNNIPGTFFGWWYVWRDVGCSSLHEWASHQFWFVVWSCRAFLFWRVLHYFLSIFF